MSNNSKIEWTDATWNPVRGCTKVSPGCQNCYAETFAERFRGVPGHPFQFGFELRLVPAKLNQPFEWTVPKRIFVNSMSDLFHDAVPDEYIEAVAAVMLQADWHVYQILTKRPERLKRLIRGKLASAACATHIWWGVSVENRRHGLPRVDLLRDSTAAVKFLSVEPLLENLGQFNVDGLDWVIVGGESGPRARPMEAAWVETIHTECRRAGVPFFFKQWGGVQKSRTGRTLNGHTYDELPVIPKSRVPSRHERQRRMNTTLGPVAT